MLCSMLVEMMTSTHLLMWKSKRAAMLRICQVGGFHGQEIEHVWKHLQRPRVLQN